MSHLNYERRTLRQLPDTIFLQPRYLQKAEVVVTNKEPEWIRRCLKQTVKKTEQHYFSHPGCEAYVYDTQNMGTDNIYRFHATGLLRMKDAVMKDVTTIRENAGDIAAAAKDINEEKQREYEAQMVEDAKAVLEQASDKAAEAGA